MILRIARIAESIEWANDLLELILQEIFNLLSEEYCSGILVDTSEESSKKYLIRSCIEGSLIERQTAVRLVIFACKPRTSLHSYSKRIN